MNEQELNRHLVGYATSVEPTPDPEGLRVGIRRVDRNRRIRAAGAAGSMAALLAFGVISLGGSDESAPELDVRGESPNPSVPVPDPDLGPPTTDENVEAENVEVEEPDRQSVTAASPTSDGAPDHLHTAPTTTVAAVAVTSSVPTTVPPPTSTVNVPPPTTFPPTTTVAAAGFSAVPRYGTCEEDPPYDEYSGTAAPGATITITSPHSATARTVADASGHWFLRVEFPAAPVGTPFTVTASDGSTSVGMSFTRTA